MGYGQSIMACVYVKLAWLVCGKDSHGNVASWIRRLAFIYFFAFVSIPDVLGETGHRPLCGHIRSSLSYLCKTNFIGHACFEQQKKRSAKKRKALGEKINRLLGKPTLTQAKKGTFARTLRSLPYGPPYPVYPARSLLGPQGLIRGYGS